MRAMVQHGHGGPEVLEYTEVDAPTLEDDQVLVRVKAASVGAWDRHVIRGDPRVMGIARMLKPKNGIPGLDFAGVIEAVGDDVTGLRPGDEVYGESEGAVAEYVAASRTSVELKPTSLSFDQEHNRGRTVLVVSVTARLSNRRR